MIVVFPTNHISDWLQIYLSYLKSYRVDFLILLDNPTTLEIEKCEELKFPFHRFEKSHESFLEDFVADIYSELQPNWILKLDSDEWMSVNDLRALHQLSGKLDDSKSYGIRREWVNFTENFSKSFVLDKKSQEIAGADIQHRLFHNSTSVPVRRVHTQGILLANSEPISLDVTIVHLIWVLKDLNSRSQAQIQYAKYAGSDEKLFRNLYVPEEIKKKTWVPIDIHFCGELTQLLMNLKLHGSRIFNGV
jgi:hypothetical protein